MSTTNPNYTIGPEWSLDGIRAMTNTNTMKYILERNQTAHSNYDAQVGSWDLRKQQVAEGVYIGPRPYPMVMLIPVTRDDGYVYPVEDPTGTLVVEPTPPPSAPPPLSLGVTSIGELFPYDPKGRRACLSDDTNAPGTKVTYKSVEYVKIEIESPFTKKWHWYEPVGKQT